MASKQSSSCRSKAVASTSSPEYLTIRECYPHLVITVKHSYDTIGDRLFSKGYVSRKVRDFIRMDSKMPEEKGRKLLDTILDRIMYHPEVFNDFIDAIEQEGPLTRDLVRELHQVYKIQTECVVSEDQLSSSDDSFHSASELDELFHIGRVSLASEKIVPLSNGDACASKKTKTHSQLSKLNDDLHTRNDDIVLPDGSLSTSNVAGFLCPFCKKCSIEEFFSKAGCPKAVSCVTEQQQMFPSLDTNILSKQDREELEAMLVRDTSDMICLFARFRSAMIKSFEAQNLVVKRVVDFVLSLGKLASIVPKALAEEDEAHLRQAKSILDVFSALLPYTSFFHYRIIEILVVEFGTPEDRQRLELYVSTFNRFCKRSVFEVPQSVFRDAVKKSDGKCFSVKYITEAIPILADVVVVRRKIAEILGISSWSLQLCSITDGCVCLRFWIPSNFADEVLPVSLNQQAALKEIGVRVLEEADTIPGKREKQNGKQR